MFLTRVGLLVGRRALALQNMMARCVRFAKWQAMVCCVAAAMSFTHDNTAPGSTPVNTMLWSVDNTVLYTYEGNTRICAKHRSGFYIGQDKTMFFRQSKHTPPVKVYLLLTVFIFDGCS